MVADGDIQRLEARIAALESRVQGQFAAPGGSGGGGETGGGAGGATPADWIAGMISQSFPSGSPVQQQMGQQMGQQAQLLGLTGSSVCWCQSRFVCATMHCGGSGWC
jgi:hypothetical protein